MRWKITFASGAAMTLNAPDYTTARRLVLNRAGSHKLPRLESISLHQSDDEREHDRQHAILAQHQAHASNGKD